jgi:hypothetical protein
MLNVSTMTFNVIAFSITTLNITALKIVDFYL